MFLLADFHLLGASQHVFGDDKTTLCYFCFHTFSLQEQSTLKIPLKTAGIKDYGLNLTSEKWVFDSNKNADNLQRRESKKSDRWL
jgi:hypothetical protein